MDAQAWQAGWGLGLRLFWILGCLYLSGSVHSALQLFSCKCRKARPSGQRQCCSSWGPYLEHQVATLGFGWGKGRS